MNSSDLIAAASLGVAFSALGVSWYGIRRANKTTSAATLATLNEAFRESWDRFFRADAGSKTYELAELLNLFEIACASYAENSLSGNSRKLLKDYLDRILRTLVKNDEVKQVVTTQLLQSPETFIFIKRFLRERKADSLSVTIPPEWFHA